MVIPSSALIRHRDDLDLELVAVATHLRLDVQRQARAPRVQPAADREPVAVHRARRTEPDVRMPRGAEEVRRAQVLVAPLIRGVEAAGLDVSSIAGPLRRSSVPWKREKRPLTVASPADRLDAELDARAVRVDLPGASW